MSQNIYKYALFFLKLANMTAIEAANILGISPNASDEEIGKAYKQLAKKFHPDVNKSPDAEKRMKEINTARDLLLSHPKIETPSEQESGSPSWWPSSLGDFYRNRTIEEAEARAAEHYGRWEVEEMLGTRDLTEDQKQQWYAVKYFLDKAGEALHEVDRAYKIMTSRPKVFKQAYMSNVYDFALDILLIAKSIHNDQEDLERADWSMLSDTNLENIRTKCLALLKFIIDNDFAKDNETLDLVNGMIKFFNELEIKQLQ